MNRAIIASAFAALALTSVAQEKRAEPKPGDRAASGNLVIHVFHSVESGKPLPAELKTDYGFMVINLGGETHPKALYRLASRAAGTVTDFQTMTDFTAALTKLPKGSTLYHYDKCTAPSSWGLKFDWSSFERTCKRLELKLADDPRITCNCPE